MGKLLIHLVDDDAVRKSIARMLTLGNYGVREYRSGTELLAAADTLDDGCILIDVNMPGPDGPTVVARLRDRSVRLPVVMMTGSGGLPVGTPGVAGFIPKPFLRATLMAILDEVSTPTPKGDRR